MLKVGAIGGIFALRFALARRNRAKGEAHAEPEAGQVAPRVRREPHPVRKKKRRRRR